jgi:hypothetical protein
VSKSANSITAALDAEGRIAVDVACLGCGYNLRTLSATGNCTECGQAVSYSTHGYLVRLDAEGRIAGDLPCITCGYNLRMQPGTGTCPECGERVAPSTRGHFLRFAPPAWVKRLSRGVLLLAIAAAGPFAAWALLIFVWFLLPAVAGGGFYAFQIGSVVFTIGFAITVIVGVTWATARDPVPRDGAERRLARSLLRICAWVAPGLAASGYVLGFVLSTGMRPTLWWVSAVAAAAAFVVGLIILPLGLFRYLSGLMRRIPRAGLAKFARILFWVYLASSALFIGGYAAMLVLAAPSTGTVVVTTGPGTPPVVTTIPTAGTLATSAPASMPVAPPAMGWFGVLIAAVGVGWCLWPLTAIAGFVLLILVQRALSAAAREAAVNAAA